MSIKPLDLQTMFVRLNEVSKEQSQNQHAAALQQDQEARKLVEQELQHNNSVNSSKEDQESGSVKDRDEPQEQEQRKQAGNKESENKKEKEVVKDPQMGTHIDISG